MAATVGWAGTVPCRPRLTLLALLTLLTLLARPTEQGEPPWLTQAA